MLRLAGPRSVVAESIWMECSVRHHRRMHLGVVVEQLVAPVPGGTGRFTAELVAALVATAESDDTISGSTAWHRRLAAAQIAGMQGPTKFWMERRLLGAAWERGLGPAPRAADVVVAPTLLVPPRRGRPLVVTIHDAVPWTHPETLTPRGVAFHRRMAQRAAREADAILVPTMAVAAALGDHLPIRVERLHVVGEGAASAVTTPPADAAERRRRLGLPPRYLLTVATLEPRKGLDVALDALALRPGLPLVVVGQSGWGGIDLATAARVRGLLADRLLALGRLPDADLAAVLAGATAVVAPSRAEGFGLPVLEAMAAGVPVVSSDDPAMVEVGGGATVVVPIGAPGALADAMTRLVDDSALRADLSARGRLRSAAFSWERVAVSVWATARLLVEHLET
jgi:glycosyltransferase involved in cell wall biosynthesis